MEESQDENNKNDSVNNSTQDMDIDKIINKSTLSKSLLYCLDGNQELSPPFEKTRKRQLEDDSLREESSTESLKRPLIESDSTDF